MSLFSTLTKIGKAAVVYAIIHPEDVKKVKKAVQKVIGRKVKPAVK